MNDNDFLPFVNGLLIGPHPETGQPNRWFYIRAEAPVPLSAEANERVEKQVWDIFNNTLMRATI